MGSRGIPLSRSPLRVPIKLAAISSQIWDDDKSLKILRNCYAKLSSGNKLLLVESVIPPGNDPFMSKFFDLTKMLIPGGMKGTEHEYRELYEKVGFALVRTVPTITKFSVIDGVGR